MANVPILTPTPYTPPPPPSPPPIAVEDLEDYLVDVSVSPRLKKLQEEIKSIYEQMELFEVRESISALRNFARVYTINGIEGYDARTFLLYARRNITRILRNNRDTKVKLIFKCDMIHSIKDIIREFAFHSDIKVKLEGTDEDNIYVIMTERILEKIARLINGDGGGGTGWAFYRVNILELHTVSYIPLRGETWVPLPKELADKKAIINMQNEDNKCFLWCVLRALNPKDNHPKRVDRDLKLKENTLNMEGIEYPVSLKKDIDKFENQNQTICITVFGYDGKIVYPLRNSDNTDREHKIRLMLIEKDGIKHYCLVKNISALLASQVSKDKKKSRYFCDRCLNHFWCEESLNKHLEYCSNHKAVKIQMPDEGTILKLKKYHMSERVPFMIYADTESLTKKIQSCEADPEKSYTKKYQKHELISFSYYIKCFDDMVYEPVMRSYTGPDASKIFVEWLEKDIKIIANIPKKNMIFGKEEEERFNRDTECWICKQEFEDDDKNYKVRNHCHFTGRYRGAAHNKCNLKYRKPDFTPIAFHNLAGHLFIKELGFSEGNIDCIPNNEEKYISFTKRIQVSSYTNREGETKPLYHKIRFIDSYKFMAASLDSLVNNLPKDAFNSVKREYKGKNLELLTRKGVYPYDYMDTPEKLKETELPPKEAFYSRLNDEDISDEDYLHAQNVWKTFEMKTQEDYHNLYNKLDVLLLADVFENFRDICIKNYNLDPAHYYTAPGLS